MIVTVVIAIWTTANKPENKFRDFKGDSKPYFQHGNYRKLQTGRIKVGRWNERFPAKRCDAADWDQIMNHRSKRRALSRESLGISGKWVMSLKGFVNRLSHDCHIDIDRDFSTEYCRSSSVFKLSNNRRKSGRTKNIDIGNILAYFTSRSTWVATRSNALEKKKSVEKIQKKYDVKRHNLKHLQIAHWK